MKSSHFCIGFNNFFDVKKAKPVFFLRTNLKMSMRIISKILNNFFLIKLITEVSF